MCGKITQKPFTIRLHMIQFTIPRQWVGVFLHQVAGASTDDKTSGGAMYEISN